jgi:hypothetical protein
VRPPAAADFAPDAAARGAHTTTHGLGTLLANELGLTSRLGRDTACLAVAVAGPAGAAQSRARANAIHACRHGGRTGTHALLADHSSLTCGARDARREGTHALGRSSRADLGEGCGGYPVREAEAEARSGEAEVYVQACEPMGPLPALVQHIPVGVSFRYVEANVWHGFISKFFTFVVTLNLVGVVLAATGVWNYPRHYTSALVLGNLLTAILMRNELFGRFLYAIVNLCFAKVRSVITLLPSPFWQFTPQWTPLQFRLGCTSALQHLGGIHSGCALSGCTWLIFKLVTIFIDHQNNHDAVLVMGVVTNMLVCISIASAFPWVRNTHHKWVDCGSNER